MKRIAVLVLLALMFSQISVAQDATPVVPEPTAESTSPAESEPTDVPATETAVSETPIETEESVSETPSEASGETTRPVATDTEVIATEIPAETPTENATDQIATPEPTVGSNQVQSFGFSAQAEFEANAGTMTFIPGDVVEVGVGVTATVAKSELPLLTLANLTYYAYPNATCTGAPVFQFTKFNLNLLTLLVVPPSEPPYAFTSPGTYSWRVFVDSLVLFPDEYTPCETLSVVQAQTAMTLTLHHNNGGLPGAQADEFEAVDQIIAQATMTDPGYNATGGLTYQLFSDNLCTVPLDPDVSFTKSVVAGVAEFTDPFQSPQAGTLYMRATYAGDANNLGSTSGCSAFTVNSATPSLSLSVSPSSITVDGSAAGSATLTNSTATAGGTVTYQIYSDVTCATAVSGKTATATVTNAVVQTPSTPENISFEQAGTWYWKATYSGDALNDSAESSCVVFVVGQAHPTISISINPTAINAGESAAATSVLSSSSDAASGTVTYVVFSDSGCATSVTSAVATVTNGVVAATHTPASITFPDFGNWYWRADYSGDTSNLPASSACTSFLVRAVPSLSVNWIPGSIIVGSSAQAGATLSGSTLDAGGSMQYQTYSDSDCLNALSTPVDGSVSVTAGAVPTSGSATFTAAGVVYVRASYSGDAQNTSASSTCAALAIDRAQPAVSVAQAPDPTSVGGTFVLTVSLSNAFGAPSESIAITIYEDNACTVPVSGMSWNLANGGSTPSISYGFAGAAYVQASFPGNSNNYTDATGCLQITLQAGSISASASDTTLDPLEFSFSDQQSTGTVVVTVVDTRGTAEGFTISIAAGSFVYSGTSQSQQDLPGDQLYLTGTGDPWLVSGQPCTPVASDATGALGTDTTIMTAAGGCGSGTYSQELQVELTVPGGSSSGEYSAELTITTSEAP